MRSGLERELQAGLMCNLRIAVGKSKDKKPRAVLLSGKTARGWLFSVTAFWEEAVGPIRFT